MSAKPFGLALFGLVSLELASLAAFRWPVLGIVLLTGAVPVMIWLGYRKPKTGLLVLVAELVTGGKGYLIFASVGGIRWSLRMVLFASFLAGYLLHRIQERQLAGAHLAPYRWPLGIFAVAFGFALLHGLSRGHGVGAVFLDANAFLYLLLWPAFGTIARDDRGTLAAVLFAGALVTAVKSFVTLAVFVHAGTPVLTFAYHWIRDTGVGEISPILGSLVRVFFQSQVYSLLAALLALGLLLPGLRHRSVRYLPGALLVGIAAGGLAVSLSRSFWLGAAFGLVALMAASGTLRFPRMLFRFAGVVAGTVLLQLFFTSWAIHFPLPLSSSGEGSENLVAGRVQALSTEAAARSRLELLPELGRAIRAAPLFGSGFARSVTYVSDDPRVRQAVPDGRFTTYSFEWGYLDQWVKLGLVGTIPFLALWFILLGRLIRRRSDPLALGCLGATVALLATHVTSPYLNHPLGLGWLMIADALTRDA